MLLGLAIIVQVIGHGMIGWAMAHLAAPLASVTLLTGPIATVFLAWPILSEPSGLPQFMGAAIVLVGVIIVRRGGREENADKASLRETSAGVESSTMLPR